MALRMLVLRVLKGEKERSLLEENLQKMTCNKLMELHSCLRDKEMVSKLLMEKSNK